MGEITRMDVRGSLSTSHIWTASEQTQAMFPFQTAQEGDLQRDSNRDKRESRMFFSGNEKHTQWPEIAKYLEN